MLAINTGLYSVGLFGFSLQVGLERDQGLLRRIRCSPTPIGWMLGSEMLVQFITFILQSTLVLLIVFVGFGVSTEGEQLGLLIPLVLLSGAMSLAIGLFLVAVVQSFRILTALSRFLLLALLFVQGIFVKLSVWPHALRLLAQWSPADVSLRLFYATMPNTHWGVTQWHLIVAAVLYVIVLTGLGGLLFRNANAMR